MSDISEIIKASLESIKFLANTDTVVGAPITTSSGITVIPISKLTVGFIGGSLDYGAKKLTHAQNFGGGSGTGVSVTPIAILTIDNDAKVNIISINEKKQITDKLISFIERSPEIIDKLKSMMT